MRNNEKKFGITRTAFLRILSLTVILAFLLPAMANAQGKANFAGTWAYNATKSDQPAGGAGGGGGGGGMRGGGGLTNFTATQEANLLTVVSSRTGQDGTVTTTTSKYTLDGKESLNTSAGRGGAPGTPVPSVATWSADGKTLTIVTTTTFNDQTMKSTQVWTLTDANTLSIASTRNGQDGTPVTTKRVYDKK